MSSPNFKLLALIIGLLLMNSGNAATLFVRTSGVDSGDCNSMAPCETVSYALAQSASDDTIDIGIGEFTEANGIEINHSITLQGAGRRLGGTILQAHALSGEASSRVIDIPFVSGGADVVIADLTIRHGVAEGVSSIGGGLNKTHNSVNLTLESVTFSSNQAESNGGGARIHVPFTLSDVEFVGNESGQHGGGLWAHDHSTSANTPPPEMERVEFSDNIAAGCGGGLTSFSIDASYSEAVFKNNTAGEEGGGLCIGSLPGSTILTSSRFEGNQAGIGGGLFLASGSLKLINSSLLSNQAENGAGLYVGSTGELPSASLINVTLTNNTANSQGGGLHHFNGESSLLNVIAWGNSAGLDGNDVYGDNDLVTLRYSLHGAEPNDVVVEGDLIVENTLTSNPGFVDSASGDLHLLHDSPAIDTGDPATDPALFPGGPTNPVDPDGNPRFFGDGPDVGAFEAQWLPDLLFQDRFELN